MPGEMFGSRKPYLSIIQGVLRQKVAEGTPNAEKREYELANGVKGSKWELSFKSWNGKVAALRLKDGEYGESLEVEFEDAVLTMSTEDRYFSDFAKKIMGADINKEISVSPYDFEVNGERKRGLSVYQGKGEDGKKIKLQSFYWNDVDKKPCNGMPQPSGDTKKFKKDDWKVFFISVKKFLITEVLKLNEKIIKTEEIVQPEMEIDEAGIAELEESKDLDQAVEDFI